MFSAPSMREASARFSAGAASEAGAALGGALLGAPGDGLAARYSALAGDGSAGLRAREGAMLFSAAELSLDEEDTSAALQKAEEALVIFREVADVSGVADSLRIVICARAKRGEREEAVRIAAQELEVFRAKGEKKGEAAMLLSAAEIAAREPGTISIEGSHGAVQSATDALSIFKALGDQKMESASLIALSTAYLRGRAKQQQKEECKRALAAGQEALALCRQTQEKRGQAKALHAMAVVCTQQGMESLDDALQFARQALTIWKDLEDRRSEALELNMIARLLLQDSRESEAVEAAQDALAILQEAKVGRACEAAVLATAVAAYAKKKDWNQAIRTAERKIAHFQADEDTMGELLAMESLFSAHVAEEDYREALRTADKALVVVRSMPSRSRESWQFEARMLQGMADVHLGENQAAKAEEALEASLKIFKDIEDADGQIQAYCTLSYASMNLREWRDAIRAAGDSRDVARQEEDRLQEAVALLALCCAHSGKGDNRRAAAVAKDAQDIFYEEEHKRGEACALYLLANVYINSQEYEKAISTAKKSQMLYREADCRQDDCNLALLAAHAAFYQALEEGSPDVGTKPSGSWQKALKVAEDALALSRKMGDDSQIGKCLLGVAQVYVMTKQSRECQEFLDEAIALAQKTLNDSAEAWARTVNAQMYWALRQEERCHEPASIAAAIFKRLGETHGESLAEEMTRLTSGGAAAAGGPAAALEEYQGPTEEMLLATVNEVAFSLIGNESLAGDTPLMDAGLDSLASVEFQNTLSKEFTGVQLPSTLVFDFPTPKTISEFIYQGLRDAYKQGKIKG